MTKKQARARRSDIIGQLSRLSKDGWRNAKSSEYIPLEKELGALNERLEKR